MCSPLVTPDKQWIKDSADFAYSSARMFTSQSYHRSFWSLLEHGVVLIDKEYHIIEANPYFVSLLGISGAELIGRDIREFISDEFVRTDTVVMNSLIEGLDSSYIHDEEIICQENRRRVPVPVRIIITRVPSQLLEDFQHFIVQVYKIEKTAHIGTQQYIKKLDQSWGDIFKALFLQPWFVKNFWWIAILVMFILILSGNFLPIVDKLF